MTLLSFLLSTTTLGINELAFVENENRGCLIFIFRGTSKTHQAAIAKAMISHSFEPKVWLKAKVP
ncbi:MAG: hypothetical protein DRR08_04510 [Candidatus Parabeggiatoa sp. nov. 2]|nr:MAG: hypothetical protein B6247_10650 [Beggiatoa sp. 4572_84]RKZ63034.1 MAG: hypothetical protein DRR08_04510 [Gammaproteobacteria bacterium]